MKNYETHEISKELEGREGVEVLEVDAHEEVRIQTETGERVLTGPMRIILNVD